MLKPVNLLSYHYPNIIKVSVMNRVYTFETSEYWARKALSQMKYGEGWKGLNVLRKNGVVINKEKWGWDQIGRRLWRS